MQKHMIMSSRGPWDEVCGAPGVHGIRPRMVVGLHVQKQMSSTGPWHEAGGAPGPAWDEATAGGAPGPAWDKSRYFVRVICEAAHEHQGPMG